MAKHNKKRNVGLLYEQLLRFACNKIVEKDNAAAEKAINIICNNFKPGSALYQEFRLFNALVGTKVKSTAVARRIIEESRSACTKHNANQLRKEKSKLIKEINIGLNDRNFYGQRVPDYKTFATVQSLLNEWRGADYLGPEEIVSYEQVLEEWLIREKGVESSIKKEHANPLTLNIMHDKFKTKYADKLSSEQFQVFEHFLQGDEAKVIEEISLIKGKAKTAMKKFFLSCDNRVLNNKRDEVEKAVNNLSESASVESVSKALVVSALVNEMEEKNG